MATGQTNEFDIMRQRIKEREQKGAQEAKKGVTGFFASRGTLGSGAEIRAQERERARVGREAQEQRRDVLIAEAQTRRAEREAAAQRAFQAEQAEKQRQLVQSESALSRAHITGERLGTERATARESAFGRGLQRELQRGQLTSAQQLQTQLLGAQKEMQAEDLRTQSFLQQKGLDSQKYLTELQLRVQQEESALGRELTVSENLAQRKMLRREAELDRQLTRDESAEQRAFAIAEAAEDRKLTRDESAELRKWTAEREDVKLTWNETQNELDRVLKQSLQTESLTVQQQQWVDDLALKSATLLQQKNQFVAEFNESIRNNIINAQTALAAAGVDWEHHKNVLRDAGMDIDNQITVVPEIGVEEVIGELLGVEVRGDEGEVNSVDQIISDYFSGVFPGISIGGGTFI